MGTAFGAICNKCGCEFGVSGGGGFFFYVLRCERCGEYKEVTIRDDRRIRPVQPEDVPAMKEYERKVEEDAGKCQRGGKFTFDAPPRCPKCKSTDFRQDPDEPAVCYD